MPIPASTPQESTGFVLWMLGPTSSGKTTIAELLLTRLRQDNVMTLHYDGDEVRDFFGDTLGFSPSSRFRVVDTLIHLANKAASASVNVIVSALTANEDARAHVREKIPGLLTCYVECSIETCAERDPKGLYGMAKRGEIDTLIGFNSEYVAPQSPDIIINTENITPSEAVDALIDFLREKRSPK